MPASPTAEEKRALCEIVIQYVAKGPVERPVVQFLFKCSIEAGNNPKHISEGHVLEGCPEGPRTEGAIRSMVSRLRTDLANFFSQHPVGRQQRLKVEIPSGGYALQFDFNNPPPMAGDLIKSFWAPYYASDRPIRIYYPDLVSADSHYVPTGIVQAMVSLTECFQRSPRVPVTASPIKPTDSFPNQDEDIIVLGNVTTMPHISHLEAGLPMRSATGSINFPTHPKKTYADTKPSLQPGASLTNWALLTRTARLVQGRLATVISAHNGRAIEAVAAFLTRQRELETLAKLFSPEPFSDKLQVLFEVSLLVTAGDVDVHHLVPAQALDLRFTTSE